VTRLIEAKEKRQPKRIQRRRIKGWRMPPNTIYVGRPTMWGNPFLPAELADDFCSRIITADGDRLAIDSWWTVRGAVDMYRAWLIGRPVRDAETEELIDPKILPISPRPWLTDLRGKDLCCWCPLDQPCHADVLLEIANK